MSQQILDSGLDVQTNKKAKGISLFNSLCNYKNVLVPSSVSKTSLLYLLLVYYFNFGKLHNSSISVLS